MRHWVAVALIVMPCIGMTLNMGFLKRDPLAYFDKNDTNLMMKNAGEVLESTAPNAGQDWSNPKTGNSGRAEVRGQFVGTDGASCKRLFVSNRVKRGDVRSETTYTVCKYADRGWVLHAAAEPMPDGPPPD